MTEFCDVGVDYKIELVDGKQQINSVALESSIINDEMKTKMETMSRVFSTHLGPKAIFKLHVRIL